MSKEQDVLAMLKEEKYTKDEILEATQCTAGSFSSYLSAFRNASKYTGANICPVEVDGVFKMTTYDEWSKAREASKGNGRTTKDPAERLRRADKRVVRCAKTLENAVNRHENLESEETGLRVDLAEINLKLAELEQAKAEEVAEKAGFDIEQIREDAAAVTEVPAGKSENIQAEIVDETKDSEFDEFE